MGEDSYGVLGAACPSPEIFRVDIGFSKESESAVSSVALDGCGRVEDVATALGEGAVSMI